MIPLFGVVRNLRLQNTYWAYFLPWIASPFGILLLRQAFIEVPRDLDDAAIVEGASKFQVFWHVILPNTKSSIITLSLISFITSWNAFLWPLIVVQDQKKQLVQVAIASLFKPHEYPNWGSIFAAASISTLPVLLVFLFMQRHYVRRRGHVRTERLSVVEGEHQPRLPVRHVIVGSVALDWIISSQGEVRRMVCGGNALYAAAGARLWSDSVAVVTRVGEDFPRQYLDNFERSGIDLSGVKSVDVPHNILSGYRYDPTGERELFSAPQEFARLGLAPKNNLEAHFFNLDWEHLDSPELNALPDDVPASYWGAHAFCINPSASDAQAQFMEILNRREISLRSGSGLEAGRGQSSFIAGYPRLLPQPRGVW